MPRLLIEKGFSQLMMKATTVFTIDRLAKAFRNTGKPITFTTRILSLLNEAKLPPTIATYWLRMRVKANALTGVFAFVQFQCLASQHTMAALFGGTRKKMQLVEVIICGFWVPGMRMQLVEVKIITGVHVISNTPTRAGVGVHL